MELLISLNSLKIIFSELTYKSYGIRGFYKWKIHFIFVTLLYTKGIMLQFLAGFLFEQFSILSIMFTLVLYALATGLVLFVNSVVNSSFD